MIQLVAVAMTLGATKADFDATMAVAPDRRRGAGDDALPLPPLRRRRMDGVSRLAPARLRDRGGTTVSEPCATASVGV